MKYIISQINWDNQEEVLFGNKTNSGTVLFPLEYATQKNKGILPTVFIVKNEKSELIGRLILATCDGESAKAFFVEGISYGQPWMYGVFVEEKYRNLGIGKALINTSIEYCREKGFKYILLDTNTAGKYYQQNWNFQFSHTIENGKSPVTKHTESLDVYYLEL